MKLQMELSTALPFDILLHIALTAPHAWRAMVAIPAIGRWARTHQTIAMERFIREVEMFGDRVWILPDGNPHSVNDKPAIVRADGERIWCKHGAVHRDDDKPAMMDPEWQSWYKDGLKHRDGDLPAAVFHSDMSDSRSYNYIYRWCIEGLTHREGDPAYICDEHIEWAKHGKRHREDGPAVVLCGGFTIWYKDDKELRDAELPPMTDAELHKLGLDQWKMYENVYYPLYED